MGVYDLRKRSWDFLTEEAHTETIFDCVFKPDNRDHLATVRSPPPSPPPPRPRLAEQGAIASL